MGRRGRRANAAKGCEGVKGAPTNTLLVHASGKRCAKCSACVQSERVRVRERKGGREGERENDRVDRADDHGVDRADAAAPRRSLFTRTRSGSSRKMYDVGCRM